MSSPRQQSVESWPKSYRRSHVCGCHTDTASSCVQTLDVAEIAFLSKKSICALCEKASSVCAVTKTVQCWLCAVGMFEVCAEMATNRIFNNVCTV